MEPSRPELDCTQISKTVDIRLRASANPTLEEAHEAGDGGTKAWTDGQSVRESLREWQLLAFHALPEWLKDNELIHGHHRPPLPCFWACFRSVFALHNETVNIWSHLLGSLVPVALAASFAFHTDSLSLAHLSVFLVYFAAAALCLTFSWVYHSVACHSNHVCRLFSRLDYSGIAGLILGSSVPWLYFMFYCDSIYMTIYLTVTVLLSSTCICLTLREKFGRPQYRAFRASVFVFLGLSGIVPSVHGVIRYGMEHTNFLNTLSVAALYISGAVLYALRVPERFFPGKLDIYGSSHQVFHALVVIAIVVHYVGLRDMAGRRLEIGECEA